MNKTLLDIAKEKKPHSKSRSVEYSREQLELSIAYIHGEITMNQFIHAFSVLNPELKMNGGSVLYKITTILKRGIIQGDLEKLKMKE